MSVAFTAARAFDTRFPVVVAGAGACGLVAALAARDAGAAVLVLERDAAPSGSTALSSGFIPAAGTRWQRSAGVADSPARMAADIERKNHDESDPSIVAAVCAASAETLEWLADKHAIPFVLVQGFLYPGHSATRMHAVPAKTGAALMAALLHGCASAGVLILASAHVTEIVAAPGGRVLGVGYTRPDGSREAAGCDALVLATSGFGGDAAMVRAQLPAMADALYFGHAGNRGDAIRWGEALGADVRDLSSYQGHGSVASPHGILITWALMMEGGIQVNARGERFANEHGGYSEQCLPVLQQPGGCVWNVFDDRLHQLGMEFDDYRAALTARAIRSAPDVAALATLCDLPAPALARTLDDVARYAAGDAVDPLGRDFSTKPALVAPFRAVRVTGALLHTQGGLAVDAQARVLRRDRTPLPNLFAGGGAARGVSGAHVWGYLSGNGLLTAVTLGRVAGACAATLGSPQ
jgi:fumarate reductase flavoprotein subunit